MDRDSLLDRPRTTPRRTVSGRKPQKSYDAAMSLANETDAIVLASIALRREYEGYSLVETPLRRDFHFGNMLVLASEPERSAQAEWVRRHAEHFEGTGIKRHTIVWERTTVGGEPATLALGLEGELQRSTVFVRDAPFVTSLPEATVRELGSDADWAQAAELNDLEIEALGTPGFIAYARWRFGVWRDDARAGNLRMWGRWHDGEFVAFAGIYAAGDLARFSTPVTRSSFRRRGAFRSLCVTAVNETLRRRPGTRVVICAEADAAPAVIYRRLGFAAVGEQFGLVCAARPSSAIGYTGRR
jgi:hypothetical protein